MQVQSDTLQTVLDAIQELRGDLKEVRDEIKSVTAEVMSMKNDVSKLQTKVTRQEDEIICLRSQVVDNLKTIDEIKSIRQDVSALQVIVNEQGQEIRQHKALIAINESPYEELQMGSQARDPDVKPASKVEVCKKKTKRKRSGGHGESSYVAIGSAFSGDSTFDQSSDCGVWHISDVAEVELEMNLNGSAGSGKALESALNIERPINVVMDKEYAGCDVEEEIVHMMSSFDGDVGKKNLSDNESGKGSVSESELPFMEYDIHTNLRESDERCSHQTAMLCRHGDSLSGEWLMPWNGRPPDDIISSIDRYALEQTTDVTVKWT